MRDLKPNGRNIAVTEENKRECVGCRARTRARACTYVRTYVRTHPRARARTHTHARVRSHARTHARARAYVHARARTHARTHARCRRYIDLMATMRLTTAIQPQVGSLRAASHVGWNFRDKSFTIAAMRHWPVLGPVPVPTRRRRNARLHRAPATHTNDTYSRVLAGVLGAD